MKNTLRMMTILLVCAMVMAFGAQALAAQDIQIEEKTYSSGITYTEPHVMPGPDGQQAIGYMVTNYNSVSISLGLTIEFRDESYGNIGSSSSYIHSVAPEETVFISVVNYYGETAAYMYATFSVAVAPTDDAATAPSGVSCSQMYTLFSSDGQQCAGYFVTNNNDYDIFLGLTVEYSDSSEESIGTSSAYIPCIGAGATACIYAVDYFGEEASYADCTWTVAKSIYESAAESIQTSLSSQDDHMRVSAVNLLSTAVSLPQVTIVYFQEAEPVYVYSGLLTDTAGYEGVSIGGAGFLNLDIPSGSWDTCYYYVTAYSSGD